MRSNDRDCFQHPHRGFTLVELSIVLVILGLLVGGVLAGQSLIHAAELRAVGTEYTNYRTALMAFRDKYFALPGDMTNATSFWGDQAAGTNACPSAATPDGTPGTCNGDGDGFIGTGSTPGVEGVRAWQQLSFASMVEGNFLGYYDSGKLTIGANVPRSKFPTAGWALLYRKVTPIWGISSNFLQLGAERMSQLWGPVFKPEDAWNIDQKFDDGAPDRGRIMLDGVSNTCVTPSAFADAAPGGHSYNLSMTDVSCYMYLKI